jgi:hypothetical protein
MLENSYVSSFKEAFTRYIGFNGPAYVERQKITPREAMALIIRVGGLPVLAHPLTVSAPETMIAGLKAAGLVGLEVHYNGYTEDKIDALARLAEKYDLIATGGSDYHGIDDSAETMLGGVLVPEESIAQLIALAPERVAKQANP